MDFGSYNIGSIYIVGVAALTYDRKDGNGWKSRFERMQYYVGGIFGLCNIP